MTARTIALFGILVFVGLGVGMLGGRILQVAAPPELEHGTWLVEGKPLAEFSLVDHRGNPFQLDNLRDKWSILFFGFTHCPDVCPTTMHSLGQVMKNIDDEDILADTQVIFVTVDPERDTPDQLARYVPFFNESFTGVTGDGDAITALTKDLGIAYMYGAVDDEGNYLVDHTAAVLVISPEAELRAIFAAPHRVDVITRDYLAVRRAS